MLWESWGKKSLLWSRKTREECVENLGLKGEMWVGGMEHVCYNPCHLYFEMLCIYVYNTYVIFWNIHCKGYYETKWLSLKKHFPPRFNILPYQTNIIWFLLICLDLTFFVNARIGFLFNFIRQITRSQWSFFN